MLYVSKGMWSQSRKVSDVLLALRVEIVQDFSSALSTRALEQEAADADTIPGVLMDEQPSQQPAETTESLALPSWVQPTESFDAWWNSASVDICKPEDGDATSISGDGVGSTPWQFGVSSESATLPGNISSAATEEDCRYGSLFNSKLP